MKVELVTKTVGVGKYKDLNSEEIIAAIARHGKIKEDNGKLVRYLMDNKHLSPLDEIYFGFEIETSRAIGRHILRHYSLSAMEHCISGESEISFRMPSGGAYSMRIDELYRKFHTGSTPIIRPSKYIDNYHKVSTSKSYRASELSEIIDVSRDNVRSFISKHNIKKHYINKYEFEVKGSDFVEVCSKLPQLYQTFNLQGRIKNMNIVVYDEDKKELTTSHIKNVFDTGVQDVYEVTLSCGRKIKSTKEHKYLTDKGFKPLKDLSVGDVVSTNGVPLHQNKEWVLERKRESLENRQGVQYIADEAGVSYHTIRKWLKKLEIQYTKKEIGSMVDVWNKGKKGYENKKWSEELKEAHRKRIPKGSAPHSWRGGGRTERDVIGRYMANHRQDVYDNYTGRAVCNRCGKENCRIELHHIEPISVNPYRAYDLTNLEPLCQECHNKIHADKSIKHPIIDLNKFDWRKVRPSEVNERLNNEIKPFSYKRKTERKLRSFSYGVSKIVSIEYIGKEQTYDLEVDHKSHNYVANKIIVHNSQRYSKSDSYEPIELRKEHPTDRQSSTKVFDPQIEYGVDLEARVINTEKASLVIENLLEQISNVYEKLLEAGVAKECARMILPECTTTILTETGSLRSWLSFLNVRCDHHAQKEIQEIATLIGEILEKELPNIMGVIDWRNGMFM